MPKIVIVLDENQIARLEQVMIDHDQEGAWQLLREIRVKIKSIRDTRCGIEKLRDISTK